MKQSSFFFFSEIHSGAYWVPYGDQVFVYDQVKFKSMMIQCIKLNEVEMLDCQVLM